MCEKLDCHELSTYKRANHIDNSKLHILLEICHNIWETKILAFCIPFEVWVSKTPRTLIQPSLQMLFTSISLFTCICLIWSTNFQLALFSLYFIQLIRVSTAPFFVKINDNSIQIWELYFLYLDLVLFFSAFKFSSSCVHRAEDEYHRLEWTFQQNQRSPDFSQFIFEIAFYH